MSRWKLRPAEGSNGLLSGRAAATAPAAAASDRPAAKLGGKPAGRKGVPHTYVPVRTLPLIFAQRRQHLQQQKAKAQHRGPYEQRDGEGLLALPEDVLVREALQHCMPCECSREELILLQGCSLQA